MSRDSPEIIGSPSAEELADAGLVRCARCNEPEPKADLAHGICDLCGDVWVRCPACMGMAPIAQFGGGSDCGCEGWSIPDTQDNTIEREF